MLEENIYFIHFNNNNPKFTSWDLSDQALTDQDLTQLAEILAKNTFIAKLDLSRNYLTGNRMLIIAEGLRNNKSLRSLKLNDNGIHDLDLRNLIIALSQTNLIIELSLANNNFGSIAAKLLINLQSLESLNLSSNNLGIGIAKMMKKLKNLHTLNYSNNHIQNAGIAFLIQNLELMELDISNTGMSEAYQLSLNSSLIRFQSFYFKENDLLQVENITRRNRNNMLIRYQHFVNFVTAFACHHYTQRSNNKDPSAFNHLPLEIQLKILNFAIPFKGKNYFSRFLSIHIGLGPSKIAELIKKIYLSAEMVKKSRGIFSLSDFAVELNHPHSDNNQSALPLNDFDLPTQNITLVPQLPEALIQSPTRDNPASLPLKNISSQFSKATINPAVLRSTPLTPPRPSVKLPSDYNETLAQEQQGYEHWQQFLEDAKDWASYIENRNNKKLVAPVTDEVAEDEDTESELVKVDANSAFAENFYTSRAEIISKNFVNPTKSSKSPVRLLFWLDQPKSPIKSPKRPAATSLSAPIDSPIRIFKARTQ